jgi:hypothetical protein
VEELQDSLDYEALVKPLLVGECNPYGIEPKFALYPLPVNSAGWRLCHKILGLDTTKYLRTFERKNLSNDPFSVVKAREAAKQIIATHAGPVILLGAKVCLAFDAPYDPFTVQTSLLGPERAMYILPHPSGRARAWNDPQAITRTRTLLREFL